MKNIKTTTKTQNTKTEEKDMKDAKKIIEGWENGMEEAWEAYSEKCAKVEKSTAQKKAEKQSKRIQKVYSFVSKNQKALFKKTEKAKEERRKALKARLKNNLLTAENIPEKAFYITVKAIKTDYTKSGNKYLEKMLFDCYGYKRNFLDAQNITGDYTAGDGANIINDTILYLFSFIGKRLDDKAGTGEKDKAGEDITILKSTFRNISRKIKAESRKKYKTIYMDDYNGHEKPIGYKGDTWEEAERYEKIIDSLELTATQAKALRERLKGKSLSEIAEGEKSKQAVKKSLDKVGKKLLSYYAKAGIELPAEILTKEERKEYKRIKAEK